MRGTTGLIIDSRGTSGGETELGLAPLRLCGDQRDLIRADEIAARQRAVDEKRNDAVKTLEQDAVIHAVAIQ